MTTSRISSTPGASRPSRRPFSCRPLGAALLCWAAFTAPLVAHDFWIEPSRFLTAPGEPVELALRVGERFAGERVAFDPERVERFEAVGGSGRTAVAGAPGDEPAGRFLPAAAGAYWIVYDNLPRPIELAAEPFEAYLAEEGLEAVSAARREHGESERAGRELYSRCAKALVVAGDGPAPPRELGLELELVLDAEPAGLASGRLPLRLLFRGAPLAGALVVARPRAAPTAELAARTDAAGAVRFELPVGGVWLVKAVHMVAAPAAPADHADADWESFWASLTLELP